MDSPDNLLPKLTGNHCEQCKKLLTSDIFHPQENLLPRTWWNNSLCLTISELVSSASSCDTCKYFLNVIRSEKLLHSQVLSSEWSHLVIGPSRKPYAVYRRPSPDGNVQSLRFHRIDITLNSDGMTYARRGTPSILPLASNGCSLFHARQLGEFADLDLAQKWLSTCRSFHGASCEPAKWKAVSGLHFRLVDVKRKCVVQAPVSCTYLALSYVWGGVKPLLLGQDNQNRLTTVGGLIGSSQNYVPQVFLDAIRVSEALGSQYVWIDAICIMQDDDDDRMVQMENMRSIYSCADLTIVSDTPSVVTGLPGLQPQPRTMSQLIYRDGQLQLTTVLPNLQNSLSYQKWEEGSRVSPWKAQGSHVLSPWESRGWTFQEKLLSKRLLIFGSNQIFFQCDTTTWSEDTILEVNDGTAEIQTFIDTTRAGNQDHDRSLFPFISKQKVVIDQSTGNVTSKWLELYAVLLRAYTIRSLSKASDAINAFYGVLDTLSSNLGQHICGLPEVVFHAAILWKYNGLSTRTLERSEFPSWSWAGWESNSPISVYGADSHDPNFGAQMYRCTSRGTFELIEASRRENHLYLAHLSSTSNELFDEQIQRLKNAVGWTDQSDQFVAEQLQSFKKALKRTLWNPFSAPSIRNLQYLKQMPPKAHMLRFWTTSAFLLVKKVECPNPRLYRAFCFPQESSAEDISRPYDGEMCSVFDSYSGLDAFALDPIWRNGQGRGLEFIILSNYTNFVATGPYEDPGATRLNAMLIEWRDDIAYRIGTAVFKEREWLQANPRWKLITLA